MDWSSIEDDNGNRTPGGSGWWRCALPAAALRQAGHEVFFQPCELGLDSSGRLVPADAQRNILAAGFNVVVLQRIMHAGLAQDVRVAREQGQVVICDVDDWYEGLDPNNAAFLASHPRAGMTRRQARAGAHLVDRQLAARFDEVNRNHFRSVLGAADLITVSTPFLARRYAKLAPTALLRNRIDLARWSPAEPQEARELRVGWVGATSWRSGDLETLRGILGPFLDRHDARFVHRGTQQGAKDAAALLGLGPEQVAETSELVPITSYPGLFHGFDIGIAPLRDTAFNHAKSAAKGIEYNAAGIPFVAGWSPEYDWYDRNSTARRPTDWITRLERLADPVERSQEAQRGRLLASEQDMARHWASWERVFMRAVQASLHKRTG